MRHLRLAELVLDFNVYPRVQVDGVHVRQLKEAAGAGVKLPPIVICAKTKRVSDGFHRVHVYRVLYGPDHLVEVIEKRYRTEAELLADAIRMNAHHGRMLSTCDRTRCIVLAEKVKLTIEETASALGMTVQTCQQLRVTRVATSMTVPVPLKRTIRHMNGRELSEQQVSANQKLSGMNQMFYANQLIMLIESGLLETDNAELMARLDHLCSLVAGIKVAV